MLIWSRRLSIAGTPGRPSSVTSGEDEPLLAVGVLDPLPDFGCFLVTWIRYRW